MLVKLKQEGDAVAVAREFFFGVSCINGGIKFLVRLHQIRGHGQRAVKIGKG